MIVALLWLVVILSAARLLACSAILCALLISRYVSKREQARHDHNTVKLHRIVAARRVISAKTLPPPLKQLV